MGYKPDTLHKIQEIQLNAYRKLAKSIDLDSEDIFNNIVSDEMLNIANVDAISFYVRKNDTLEFKILKLKRVVSLSFFYLYVKS